MNDGHIQYEVHYPNDDKIVLKSEKKYNTGEKQRISADKFWNKPIAQDIAVLKINDETIGSMRKENINGSVVVRLRKVNYYFGGVPPEYFATSNGVTASLHTHQSLMGGLEELREYQLFNDDNIQQFGVTKRSAEVCT